MGAGMLQMEQSISDGEWTVFLLSFFSSESYVQLSSSGEWQQREEQQETGAWT
jgi:hypothetical protein